MLDPSVTALVDHLNWSPPAIMHPAPSSATDQRMADYVDYVTREVTRLTAWIEHGLKLRDDLWRLTICGRSSLDLDAITNVIDQFEDGLKQEAAALARKEKLARLGEKALSGSLKAFAEHQHSRLLKVARDFYKERRDFASFLRALRAELMPESRGGPNFEDAAALQEYLLKSLA